MIIVAVQSNIDLLFTAHFDLSNLQDNKIYLSFVVFTLYGTISETFQMNKQLSLAQYLERSGIGDMFAY